MSLAKTQNIFNSAKVRHRVNTRIWRNRYIYLLVIPVIIYMILLKYMPMYYQRASF